MAPVTLSMTETLMPPHMNLSRYMFDEVPPLPPDVSVCSALGSPFPSPFPFCVAYIETLLEKMMHMTKSNVNVIFGIFRNFHHTFHIFNISIKNVKDYFNQIVNNLIKCNIVLINDINGPFLSFMFKLLLQIIS